MESTIKKEEDGSIILTVTIPLSEVKKTESVIIDEYVKNAELPGFRKGKAPIKAVEKNLDKEKVKEEVLRKLRNFLKTSSLTFSLSRFFSTAFIGALPFLKPGSSAFLTYSSIITLSVFFTSLKGIVTVKMIDPSSSFLIVLSISVFEL